MPVRCELFRAVSLLLGGLKKKCSGVFIAETPIDAEALLYTYRENALVAFSLLLGIPEKECSGVFFAENAHRCRSPTLHLQGKCSTRTNLRADLTPNHDRVSCADRPPP